MPPTNGVSTPALAIPYLIPHTADAFGIRALARTGLRYVILKGMATTKPASPRHQPPTERAYQVAVGGSPHFGRQIATLLAGDGWDARYLNTRGWRPLPALRALQAARRAEALYLVGGQIARGSRPHALRLLIRRPTVMHWTGTDVLYARRTARRGHAVKLLRRGCTHWTGAPWHVEELATIGIRAVWLPHSAVEAPAYLPPFGEPFTILAYLRPGREEFYGAAAILTVAAALPDARVLVVGVERLAGAPANVRALGWVADMAGVYAESHALLRLPRHDGLSFMVQEALAFGRYAVWNHPFPGVHAVDSVPAATAHLRLLADRHAAGGLPLNEAGAAHIRERFNTARVRADLRRELATVIESHG